MPAFSRNLKQSLDRALASARERHHEYATLEHLLLNLIDDTDAAAVLRACSVDLEVLKKNLLDYIDRELDNLINSLGFISPSASSSIIFLLTYFDNFLTRNSILLLSDSLSTCLKINAFPLSSLLCIFGKYHLTSW